MSACSRPDDRWYTCSINSQAAVSKGTQSSTPHGVQNAKSRLHSPGGFLYASDAKRRGVVQAMFLLNHVRTAHSCCAQRPASKTSMANRLSRAARTNSRSLAGHHDILPGRHAGTGLFHPSGWPLCWGKDGRTESAAVLSVLPRLVVADCQAPVPRRWLSPASLSWPLLLSVSSSLPSLSLTTSVPHFE